MQGLSLLSQISLYVLLTLLGLFAMLLWVCQVMTTATSLRFYNPKINPLMWFIGYPFKSWQ